METNDEPTSRASDNRSGTLLFLGIVAAILLCVVGYLALRAWQVNRAKMQMERRDKAVLELKRVGERLHQKGDSE